MDTQSLVARTEGAAKAIEILKGLAHYHKGPLAILLEADGDLEKQTRLLAFSQVYLDFRHQMVTKWGLDPKLILPDDPEEPPQKRLSVGEYLDQDVQRPT